MKRNLLYGATLFMLATGFVSCDDDSTAGLTYITSYPEIEILGNTETVTYIGEEYKDAGCKATIGESDVTESVKTTSNVDNSKLGIYAVTYTATNDDGFSTNASRTVYVADPDPQAIETLYFGESQTDTRHYTNAPIFITDNGDGTYLLDDLLGGLQFYGINAGLESSGYDFHAEVNLRIKADNTVEQVGNTGSWYFGDSGQVVAKLSNGTFDPATRTFVLNVDYGGTPLTVTLKAMTK